MTAAETPALGTIGTNLNGVASVTPCSYLRGFHMTIENNKGFSLVELIVVIAIMAILVGVAVPVYNSYITRAQETADADYLSNVSHAAQLFAAEHGLELKAIWVAPEVTESAGIELILSDGSRYTVLDDLYAMVGSYKFKSITDAQSVDYYTPTDPSEPPVAEGHEHDFSVVVEAPTCVKDGTNKCSKCETTTTVSATGHKYSEANVTYVGNLRFYPCIHDGCGYVSMVADGEALK